MWMAYSGVTTRCGVTVGLPLRRCKPSRRVADMGGAELAGRPARTPRHAETGARTRAFRDRLSRWEGGCGPADRAGAVARRSRAVVARRSRAVVARRPRAVVAGGPVAGG